MELITTVSRENVFSVRSILEMLDENQVYGNHTNASLIEIIKLINDKLSASKTRQEGLLHLSKLLEQSNLTSIIDLLQDNFNLWFYHCKKECEISATNGGNSTMCWMLMKKLILMSKESIDIKKYIQTQELNNLLNIILNNDYSNTKINNKIQMIHCLEILLSIYNGSLQSYKATIEQFLVDNFIDCESEPITLLVGRCFHILQLVNEQSCSNKVQLWSKQQNKLCKTIHYLYNILFEYYSINNEYNVEMSSADSILSKLDTKLNKTLTSKDLPLIQQINCVVIYFCNCISYLQNMIMTPFPVIKSINIDMILRIITRGFSLNIYTDVNDTYDLNLLKLFVPKLHTKLYHLLTDLISCLNTNLLSYSSQIYSFILQGFQRTSFLTNDENKLLKISLYKCLNEWLINTKSTSNYQIYVKDIINSFILKDINITLHQNTITLKNNAKKFKKQNTNDNITVLSKQNDLLNVTYKMNDVNVWALKTLQNILKFDLNNVLKNFEQYENIQRITINNLLKVQQSQHGQKQNEYILELYKTLFILITTNHSNNNLLQYAIQIFTKGQNSSSSTINKYCTDCLLTIKNMIHPILPTLYLPNKNVKNENGHHQFNLFINDNTGLNKIDKHNENPGRIDENNENPPIIGSNDEYYVNPRRTSESVRSKDDNEDNVITLSDDDNEMIVDKDAEILEKLKRLESVEELDETIIEDSNDQSISKLTTQTITIDDQPKPGTSSSTITISDEYHVNDRLQQKPGTSSTILSTITIDDAVQQKTISTSQTITIDGDENVSKKESSPVVIINDQENSQLSSVSVVNDNDNEEIINENMMITTFVNISNI